MQRKQLTGPCLLLDSMGTLVRLAPPAPRLRTELAERFGIEVSLEQAQRAVAAEIRYYRAHMQDGRDAASVDALRRRCAQALRGALPNSDRLQAVGEDAMTATLLACLQFSAFDDVPDALTLARARGRRITVVSNWDASLPEVLGRVGLAGLIDRVVTSAQAGVGKPDPAIFEFALGETGASASHSLHVGDSLDEDVAGARAAGIKAVWLNRSHSLQSVPAGVPTISSLRELGRLL
jgi:putative hydrolase of the HAD superfamily